MPLAAPIGAFGGITNGQFPLRPVLIVTKVTVSGAFGVTLSELARLVAAGLWRRSLICEDMRAPPACRTGNSSQRHNGERCSTNDLPEPIWWDDRLFSGR
jgi:hypothetical protein